MWTPLPPKKKCNGRHEKSYATEPFSVIVNYIVHIEVRIRDGK
jgi:hypothetical protein